MIKWNELSRSAGSARKDLPSYGDSIQHGIPHRVADRDPKGVPIVLRRTRIQGNTICFSARPRDDGFLCLPSHAARRPTGSQAKRWDHGVRFPPDHLGKLVTCNTTAERFSSFPIPFWALATKPWEITMRLMRPASPEALGLEAVRISASAGIRRKMECEGKRRCQIL